MGLPRPKRDCGEDGIWNPGGSNDGRAHHEQRAWNVDPIDVR